MPEGHSTIPEEHSAGSICCMNRSITAVMAASVILLAGCLEYEDELTIFSDGGGEHRVRIGQSLELEEMGGMASGMDGESVLDEDLASDFDGAGVEIVSERVFTDTRVNAQNQDVDYQFQEIVVRYDRVADSPWFDEQSGPVHFERGNDGAYRFERVFRGDELADEQQDPVEAAQMRGIISMLFPDAVFRFIVELPAEVAFAEWVGSEGSREPQVEGARVTWEIPLFDLMGASDDFVMVAETVAE